MEHEERKHEQNKLNLFEVIMQIFVIGLLYVPLVVRMDTTRATPSFPGTYFVFVRPTILAAMCLPPES